MTFLSTMVAFAATPTTPPSTTSNPSDINLTPQQSQDWRDAVAKATSALRSVVDWIPAFDPSWANPLGFHSMISKFLQICMLIAFLVLIVKIGIAFVRRAATRDKAKRASATQTIKDAAGDGGILILIPVVLVLLVILTAIIFG